MKKTTPLMKELPAEELRYPYVVHTATSGTVYYITQIRPDGKQKFTLWRQEPEGYRRITTDDSPLRLYERIDKIEEKGKTD